MTKPSYCLLVTINFTGLIIGVECFLAIGLGFVWVIKLEYHVGARAARWVLPLGLLVVGASVLMPGFWSSALLGLLGGTIVWGATELPDQEKRALAGQFPVHPKRKGADDEP